MSRSRNRSISLVRQWGTQWERWDWLEGSSKEPQLVEQANVPPAANALPAGFRSILAVPARLAIAVPLWVESVDSVIVNETANLELDVRGLTGRRQTGDAVLRTIAEDNGRTLVLATVFPPDLSEDVPSGLFDQYEASPFLRALQPDSITIWRENDDLVAAVTRGSSVVYWEALGWTDDAREISGWLQLIVIQLRSESVVATDLVLVNEIEGFKDGVIKLPPGVARSVPSDSTVLPSTTNSVFRWRPPAAVAAGLAAAQRRRIRQFAYAAGAVYAGIAVMVLAYLATLHIQISARQREAAELQEVVGKFQPIAQQWEQVAPTAESDYFPLEILHQVVEHLPADGVRLTLFDIEAGRVLIRGDASPSRLAAPFFDALTSDSDLSGFTWEMANPGLRPDGSASFEIQGSFSVL